MSFREYWYSFDRPAQISQIYGTLLFLGLITYFFIMYAVGLVHIVELRVFNFFIMLVVEYYALQHYRKTHKGRMNYFRALTIGTAIATIGTATFAVFLVIYLKIDQNLMQSIIENEPMGRYLNEYIAAAVIMAEGIFSGFGIIYLLTNVMPSDEATEPTG